MKKTIRTLTELQTLRSFKARRGVRDVVIELPGSAEEIRKLEKAINNGLRACGCEVGAIFVAIGLPAIAALPLIAPYRYNSSPKTLFGVVGLLAALALTGKVIGLAIANLKLRLAIDKFERDTSPR